MIRTIPKAEVLAKRNIILREWLLNGNHMATVQPLITTVEKERAEGLCSWKKRQVGLQARAMDDLHVDSKFLSVVVEDKDTNAATARLESTGEATDEVGLVNDREALLDVAGLGHGRHVPISEVENAVLLEDGAEHGLNDDAGGRIGDERGLLMQLLAEEIDT